MTEAHLDFGTTPLDTIVVETSSRPITLHPAVGGAQVTLWVKLRTRAGAPVSAPYQLSATMFVSRTPRMGMRRVCELAPDYYPQPGSEGGEISLRGFISDAQILALEKFRAGGDLWIRLQLSATRVDPDPLPRLTNKTGDLDLTLAGSDWLKALRQAQGGTFMEVLLPLTGDPAYVEAVKHIVKARELIQDGHPGQAVAEIRQSVEIVRSTDGPTTLTKDQAIARFNAAREKRGPDRTKEEGWTVLVGDLFSLTSAAAHPTTGQPIDWSDDEASALVGIAACLLAQMVAENHARTSDANAAPQKQTSVYPVTDPQAVS
jgi:hypothetical protein